MKMTGEERIEAPRARVWEALNDPEVLRGCIPGCLSLERESTDRLRAVAEVKVGPIGARFNSTITLSDIDPQRSYRLSVEGQGGTVGSAKSDIRVRLAEEASGTLLSYEVDATVGGRLAQLGGALIDATAKQLAGRFFKRFGELVRQLPEDAPSAGISEGPSASVRAAQSATAVSSAPTRSPVAWLLAVVVAALVGFLVGRAHNTGESDWMGLAIGLLLLLVASAAFESGRRAGTPQIVLDAASLQRLLDGARR